MQTLVSNQSRLARIRPCDIAREAVKKCLFTHEIRDYLAGQITYNLGDYPARFRVAPTEYDERLIKCYAEHGVGMIQIHEEWNDVLHLYGGDKYSSPDPDGMRQFVELCHANGIKIIAYASTGLMDERDPDYRPEFIRIDNLCASLYFRYRCCYAGNPRFRTFILDKMERILAEYGFDGLYNDLGYDGLRMGEAGERARKGLPRTQSSLGYDPVLEELLLSVREILARYKGIYKLHVSNQLRPPCKAKVYDYLWIGEGLSDPAVFDEARAFAPYLVPCPDYKWQPAGNPEYQFAAAIPFLQFPLFAHGRPMTGAKLGVEGVAYFTDEPFLTDFYTQVGVYHRAHPDGPHVYSEWSSIPDDPAGLDRYFDYLALYKPMVVDGATAMVDIRESAFSPAPLPERVHMSAFAADKLYLVIANLGDKPQSVSLTQPWRDRRTRECAGRFAVAPGKIVFLEYIV